ncbi:MAG TPA: hypothetical protein VF825_12740 [Oryzihumus sp.]
MALRFNSPPNWPTPPSPEWRPAPGWQPGEDWPPAPKGWQLRVEPEGARPVPWVRQHLIALTAAGGLFTFLLTLVVMGTVAGPLPHTTNVSAPAALSAGPPAASPSLTTRRATRAPAVSSVTSAPKSVATAKPARRSAPSPAVSVVASLTDVKGAAHEGCVTFESAVAPVIRQNVKAHDLAPIIRIGMGQPARGGAAEPNAPWFLVDNHFMMAAGSDATYQPLADAWSQLATDITGLDPTGDLSGLTTDAQAVTQQCGVLHALW